MGWVGFNCSIPHKIAVLEHLDGLAPSAEIIGAVNCVVRRQDPAGGPDHLIGENTDGQGFLASLLEVVDPQGLSVVVLGAGGAARAIAVEVALAGARSVTVVNRDAARGQALVKLLSTRTPAEAHLVGWATTYSVPADVDVVINGTSIGMEPTDCPDLDRTSLRADLVVADVIAGPTRTAFLRAADGVGAPALDGTGMLVNQGALGVRLWTGLEPDVAVMRAALSAALSST